MNIREIVGWVGLLGILVIILYPLGFWFNHSDLTQMEVLIEIWWIYVVAIPLYFMSRWGLKDILK